MSGQCLRYGPKRNNLAKEITLALALKVLVIYALWSTFFSQPVDDNLSAPEVGKALFGAAAATSHSSAGAIFGPEKFGLENIGSENIGSENIGSENMGKGEIR